MGFQGGFRINTNTSAVNTYRSYSSAQAGLERNIERLSSGLRINRAADDSAGLSISQRMSNQVRGMQQAKKAGASTIPVLATTPQKLLHLYFNEISMTSLDYVNVDTEGNELEILKAWPYHSHCVNAFTVANPYYCNEDSIMDELEDILVTRGYIHKKSLRYSEVFVKVESCPRDIDDTALHRA